jgi:site-specific DNA recombinase
MSETAIIYTRVSSYEQSKGTSLETQLDACRRYCAAQGLTVLGEYADAHTGTELRRPGFDALMVAARAQPPTFVVLHDVDRLGRDRIVIAYAERDLERLGVRVAYVLGGGTRDDSDKLLASIKQAIAVYDNQRRAVRTRDGMEGRVRRGQPMVSARAPYGWEYVPGDRAGQLVHHPEEAPIVQKIYQWMVHDHLTTCEIAHRLTAQGVPTRADRAGSIIHKQTAYAQWDHRSIAKIVKAEVHKGEWAWGKTKRVKVDENHYRQRPRPREEWVTVTVEPLVDSDTWQRAQDQLAANRRYAIRNARHDYLLRSLIFCSCGRRWGGHQRGRDDTRLFYRCGGFVCPQRFSISAEMLEGAVLGAVKAFLSDPETRRVSLAAEQERVMTARQAADADVATIDRDVNKIERQLETLLDHALDELFPAKQIEARTRSLTAERARLLAERERQLAALAAPVVDVDTAIAELEPLVQAAFTAATTAELRQLLELLRVEVHVIDRETVRVTGIIGDIETSLAC